jgi:glycosyltransferase involved in cell wall biosynthesis
MKKGKKASIKPSITFIITAYNEEKNLEDTINICDGIAKDVLDDYELLIVNDGSSDSTGEIAKRLLKKNPHVTVHHNKKNMGLGYSLRKGNQLAKKEYSIWIPGDNETLAKSIKKILSHAGEVDLVIPYTNNPSARPFYRRIISRLFISVMNLLFGLNLRYYNGVILCKTKLMQNLKLTSNSVGLMAEVIVSLIKTGHTYKEVPVYIRKTIESGHIFRIKNLVGIVKTVSSLFFKFQILRSNKKVLIK